MFTLGLIYEEGDGVQKNILKAADWYQKGAQAGIPSCLYNLGKLIINKEISGVEEKGFNLIQQAAESGYSFAQNYMGRCLFLLPIRDPCGSKVEKRFHFP